MQRFCQRWRGRTAIFPFVPRRLSREALRELCRRKAQFFAFYTCSFFEENQAAIAMFTKRRRHFPPLFFLTGYTTYFVHPKAVGAADLEDGCALRPLEAPDEPSVLEFLAREGARRQFAPVVRSLTDFYGLARQDCYWLEKDGTCLAFCALWYQSAYKQYVAVRYGGLLKPLSLLPALLGYPPLPRLRVPLDFPVLSFFYAAGNELLRYRGVLAQVAAKLRARCEMFASGLADGDPREALFRGLL